MPSNETGTLVFGTAPVPQLRAGRQIEPNPFDGKFPTPEGQALTITLPGTADDNKAAVTNLTGKARRAADRLVVNDEPHPMTARVQVTEDGKGKTAKTILLVWTVEKIARPTKADETAKAS